MLVAAWLARTASWLVTFPCGKDNFPLACPVAEGRSRDGREKRREEEQKVWLGRVEVCNFRVS